MMPFQWLTRLFSTVLSFIMPSPGPSDDMCIFATEPQRGATSATLLLSALKNRNDFLRRGLGNIHVEQIEYRKCCPSHNVSQHEYLVVTVKESSGAGRSGFLMVDRLHDSPTPNASQSNSSTASSSTTTDDHWDTPNRLHHFGAKVKNFSKWYPIDAFDRVVILRSIDEALEVQGGCPYHCLMTMDFSQAQRRVTLEHFLLLLQTTSTNTVVYHLIFAQCYWFAYTIWKVLDMEAAPHIARTKYAPLQGRNPELAPGMVLGRGDEVNEWRAPETVKLQWEEAKVIADQEWVELRDALLAPERARTRAEEALQQERVARQQAEAEVNQLRATLARYQSPAGDRSYTQ
ncbi:uncharacterized protein BT62DRAFT_939017 [Guyanagaster necrorhizus]|uniref:Uncharacterized protein n=1 Tax=Guyanagaster necrorhizus TaxID=856835 RepID=A0A9P8AL54_9AGAR|nr:uncharacterized protein BT62DRAFT_939017 [Guyanagaster necrorhizus MCA 3950]KAG7439415.1 hypothetical protein BT62DRAFT_939017 [Guyanagaster necrorhizus MCA 3950]